MYNLNPVIELVPVLVPEVFKFKNLTRKVDALAKQTHGHTNINAYFTGKCKHL